MNPQPQPLVSITTPATRYGASSFRVKDLAQQTPGQSPYFDTDRIRAMAVYAETGNTNEVERQTGIDHATIGRWVNDESTGALVDELRSTIRFNYGWKLADEFGKTLDMLGRRRDEGDAVVLKDGRVVFKPVSFRDLVVGVSILLDKWSLISGTISNETMLLGRMDDLSKQLTMMGGSLKSVAPSSPPDGTPIEDHPGENLIG